MSSSAKRCVTSGVRSTRPCCDHRHQPPHALLAAGAQRRDDVLIAEAGVEALVRHRELAGIDAEARQRAAGPRRTQRVLERLLLAERFDRDVDAAAFGQALDVGDRILARIERDVRAEPARHLEPALRWCRRR